MEDGCFLFFSAEHPLSPSWKKIHFGACEGGFWTRVPVGSLEKGFSTKRKEP